MRKFLKINSSIKVRIGVKSIIVPVPKSSESRNKLSILDQVRLNNADWLIVDHLTTLTWKNLCITELSTKIHSNTRLAASQVFHMFMQSIKFF